MWPASAGERKERVGRPARARGGASASHARGARARERAGKLYSLAAIGARSAEAMLIGNVRRILRLQREAYNR